MNIQPLHIVHINFIAKVITMLTCFAFAYPVNTNLELYFNVDALFKYNKTFAYPPKTNPKFYFNVDVRFIQTDR